MQLNMVRTQEAFDEMLVALEAFELITDERFASPEARMAHPDELTAALREKFKVRTSEEWVAILKDRHGLPIERVATFNDLLTDEHLSLNGIVAAPIEDVGIDRIINDPVNVQGIRKMGAKRAPNMGEHNEEILSDLGFSSDEINALAAKGII